MALRLVNDTDDDPGDEWVAQRLAIKKYRAELWEYRPRQPRAVLTTLRRHGTQHGYQQGCGCQPCRDAHNTAVNDWRRRNRVRLVAS